jgi:molybdate transport system substrate-binding protein
MTGMQRRAILAAVAGFMAMRVADAAFGAAPALLVFAAASLKNALDAAAAAWHRETRKQAVVSYAASSMLAKQIANGAPADLFISADRQWMDYLEQRKLIRPQTRIDLLGNSLVLVAPKDSTVRATVGPGFPLVRLLGDGRLAMAEPRAVPAGIYGKTALEKLGVWPSVKDRLAVAADVRAALALVARGGAPLGIVYKTDAAVEPGVKIVGVFPADSHPQIVYPMALTVQARPDAAGFETYLRGDAAGALFAEQGFTVLDRKQ